MTTPEPFADLTPPYWLRGRSRFVTTPTAPCPSCGSSERVEVVAPPTWDPDARYLCRTCNLSFDGSQEEAQQYRERRAAKARDRDDMHRRADTGRALGVIGDQP